MTYYSLNACESLIDRYVSDYNGEITTVEEGVLGLGTIVLRAEGKKTL